MSSGMNGHGWNRSCDGMKNIDEVYHSVLATGPKGGAITFDILGSAVKSKSGNVTTFTFDKPISVQLYGSNGTAVISMPNRTYGAHKKPVRTSYNNSTINPSGASAVIAIKNITLLGHDRNSSTFQFTGLSAYLPNGSVKAYTFTPPVVVQKSWENKTSTIVAGPAFWSDIQGITVMGTKFPANATPVPLKTIDAAK